MSISWSLSFLFTGYPPLDFWFSCRKSGLHRSFGNIENLCDIRYRIRFKKIQYNYSSLFLTQTSYCSVKFIIIISVGIVNFGNRVKKVIAFLRCRESVLKPAVCWIKHVFVCIDTDGIQPFIKRFGFVILVIVSYCFEPRFLKQIFGFNFVSA